MHNVTLDGGAVKFRSQATASLLGSQPFSPARLVFRVRIDECVQ